MSAASPGGRFPELGGRCSAVHLPNHPLPVQEGVTLEEVHAAIVHQTIEDLINFTLDKSVDEVS